MSAGFQRTAQRCLPRPVGSRELDHQVEALERGLLVGEVTPGPGPHGGTGR